MVSHNYAFDECKKLGGNHYNNNKYGLQAGLNLLTISRPY